MLNDILIMCVAIIISAIFNSEQDTIMFKPLKCWFANSIWWTQLRWQNRSWLIKYPLSMFGDGWHFCKFVSIISIHIGISIVIGSWWYWLGAYCLNGLIFNLFYDDGLKGMF